MNLRTPLRRTTVVVAGAFIGLAGAFAFIAPASAHTGELTATTACIQLGWTVHWKLTTTDTNGADGILSNVTFTHEPPPPGHPGEPVQPRALTTFVEDGKVTGDGVFTEDQTFGTYIKSAELQFTVTWRDGNDTYTKYLRAEVPAPTHCPIATVTATPPITPPGAPAEDATIPTSTTTPPNASASAAPTPILSEDTTGSGGGLPVTGAAAGTIAGVAAPMLAAGGVLFVMSRRRKVKFTA